MPEDVESYETLDYEGTRYGGPCLGNLIVALEADLAGHGDRVLPIGFSDPDSYRGYYEQLAFEVRHNVRVSRMLADAKGSLGRTFEGYKGGDYTMHSFTQVWLCEYGRADGETIGALLLSLLLRQTPVDADA